MNRMLLASAISAAFAVTASTALAEAFDTTFPDAPIVLAATASTESPAVLAAAPAGDASGGQRAGPEGRAFRNPSERVEARLAYLKTALKITDAQQPQWESFANVLRKHAQDRGERIQKFRAQGGPRPDAGSVTAIERLERTQSRMVLRAARLNDVIAAAKPLYAALSPEQQAVADEMLARQGQRGQPGHQRQHHRGMHRGAV